MYVCVCWAGGRGELLLWKYTAFCSDPTAVTSIREPVTGSTHKHFPYKHIPLDTTAGVGQESCALGAKTPEDTVVKHKCIRWESRRDKSLNTWSMFRFPLHHSAPNTINILPYNPILSHVCPHQSAIFIWACGLLYHHYCCSNWGGAMDRLCSLPPSGRSRGMQLVDNDYALAD